MVKFFSTRAVATKCLLIFPLIAVSVSAQDRFPDDGVFFSNSTLARVDITIHPDSLALILAGGNEQSDHEYMATFKFTRGTYTETIDSIGFRLRGNTSRYSAKKSFKVSLNTFIRGQKFHGVEKINLNGEHNDPSISRALLSWYLFREAGVPGSRANHVRLYINDTYRGLYINVEHIDDEFVDLRFGNNNGNLYKCLWPADLDFLGGDPDLYKYDNNGRRAYELKINEETDDYSDLAHFIDVLNNTSDENLSLELNRVFNINLYLKYLAVEMLIGHWDAYSYNKNNYYVYYNEGTRKFEFIPYDPDNTFGISWGEYDWTERNMYDWARHGEARPLTTRIMENQVFRDRFSFYVQGILNNTYSNNNLDPLLDSVREQIMDAAMDDSYRTLDYGYDYSDFYNSFEVAAGAHVRSGIKPFVNARSVSFGSQMDLQPINPIITLLYVNQPDLFENAEVHFMVEDDGAVFDIKAFFASDETFNETTVLSLEGGGYQVSYPGRSTSGTLRFYLEATDDALHTSRDPEEGWYTIYYGLTADDQTLFSRNLISLSPNPASGYLDIEIPYDIETKLSKTRYRIFDMSGRIMQQGELDDVKDRILLQEDIRDGVYLLELEMKNGRGHTGSRYAKFILSRY